MFTARTQPRTCLPSKQSFRATRTAFGLNPQAGRPFPVGHGKRARLDRPTDVMQRAKALSTEETFPSLCPLTESRALPADNANTQNYRVVFHQSANHNFLRANHRLPASSVHRDRIVLFHSPSSNQGTRVLQATHRALRARARLWLFTAYSSGQVVGKFRTRARP